MRSKEEIEETHKIMHDLLGERKVKMGDLASDPNNPHENTLWQRT